MSYNSSGPESDGTMADSYLYDPSRPGQKFDPLVDMWVEDPSYTPHSAAVAPPESVSFLRRRSTKIIGTIAVLAGIGGAMHSVDGSRDGADTHKAAKVRPAATASPFAPTYPTVYNNGNIPIDPTNGDPIIDLATARSEFPTSPTAMIKKDMQSIVSLTYDSTRLDPLGTISYLNGVKVEGGGATGFAVNVSKLGGKAIMSAGHVYPTGYTYYNGTDTAYAVGEEHQYPYGLMLEPDKIYTRYSTAVDESTDNGEPDISLTTITGGVPDAVPALPVLPASYKIPFGALVVNPNDQPPYTAPTKEIRGPSDSELALQAPTVIDGIDIGPDPQQPNDDVVITGIGNESDAKDFTANVGGSSGSPFILTGNGDAYGVLSRTTFDRKSNTPRTWSSWEVQQRFGTEVTDNGKPTNVYVSWVDRIPADPTTQTGTTPTSFTPLS